MCIEGRKLLRPFFLTPDGAKALPAKRYYDYFTLVITQTTFSFVVAPFIYLTISDSLKVWSRVYFYCVIGVAASIGFLNSPGKAWLKSQLRQRNAGMMQNDKKKDKDDFPVLGMPEDPVKELKEMVTDVNDARKIMLAQQNSS